MKALTVRQPHASAIMIGVKRYETRSWPTKHRGLLAIHAAANIDVAKVRALRDGAYTSRAMAREICEDATSVVLGIVELVSCIPAETVPSGSWRLWGDFAPGRWAWEMRVVERFETPIPATGKLSLWEWNHR